MPPRSTPRTELFIDGRFEPAAIGSDVRRHRRPRRLARSRGSPRASAEDVDRRSPLPARVLRRPALERPAAGGAQEGPAAARRARPRAPRRARPARIARCRQADPRHARGGHPERRDDPPVVRRDDRQGRTARSARPGPDALSLVTREPIGVVARDRALELPADHHGLEAGRRARDRQLGRAQAGQPVAADARCASPSWPPRPASPTASSTSSPARARSSATRWRAIPASTRSRSPARPRSAARCCGRSARRTSRPSRWSSAARARRSSWPTSATSRRPPRRSAGGSSTTAARPATPGRGSSSIARSARSSSSGSRRSAKRLAPGRAARPEDPPRLDRRRAPAGQGPRLRRARARGGRPGRGRRRARPGGDAAAPTSGRRSSMAWPTRCGSRARRSSGRS